MKQFDAVLYNIGDKVIPKNKQDWDGKPLTVKRTEMVQSLNNYEYQVLFFEEIDSFHVAFNYEPFNEEERKIYYEAMKDFKHIVKNKVKKSKKQNTKVLTFQIKQNHEKEN